MPQECFDFQGKEILFILNPAACHGTASSILPEIARILEEKGLSYDVAETKAPRHATELARDAAGSYDVIISVGGDGTAHETANGILQATGGDGSGPVFGVIPIGSGNDFSRTLGMFGDESTRVQRLLSCQEVPFDAGTCNGEYFIETFSIGLDANIANRTIYLREQGSTLKNTPLYLRAALDVFTKFYDPVELEIELDGERFQKNCLIFACQIGPSYGGGFPIALDAKPDDGLFDTISAPYVSRRVALPLFLQVMKGKHAGRTDVLDFRTAKHVHLKAGHELTGQLDGEPWTFDEFDLQLLPGALKVLAYPQLHQGTRGM